MLNKVLNYLSCIFLVILTAAGIFTLNFFGGGFALIIFGAYAIVSGIVVISVILGFLLGYRLAERCIYGGKHKRSVFSQVLQKLQAFKARRG